MPEDGPQHSGGMTGSLKAARAAVVLVAFVVAVAILVAVGTRSTPTTPSSAQTTSTTAAAAAGSTTTTAAAASSTTTSTTAKHGHGAATTTTTAPHASVSVVVANATNTNGLAAHYSTVVGAGGWKMGTPIDASTKEATSTVYYAAGQQAAAQSIANTIGVKPTQVQPLTTAAPVAGVTGTDVVVVIGQDLASTSGS
ncbi:MAG TPA: LytR C-terminal domain-containing protein [Acidimicrobiales bacterium]|nr:LytR C-terminal domain-containing protein [Acidimicrobiales bacterium]